MGALAFPADSHNLDGGAPQKPSQPFRPECFHHSFREEEAVTTRSIGEVTQVFAIQFQGDTVGWQPFLHADGIATLGAMGGIATVDGLNPVKLSVMSSPYISLKHEEARIRWQVRNHGGTS